ncbi:MAG: 4Fe-4S binding protein [Spirochaetes bacterium]|nr:4Fe-4S binding protein [Spirochaetota bacterium]
MRLLTYFSDLPCDEGPWFPVRRMETCEKCKACITACPTDAIESNQHIVNTSKCLTFLNEFAGEFPDWVNKDAHNSIIGCMKCQDCCPKNAHNKNNILKGVTFTEKETLELLIHEIDEPYTGSLKNKIKATGISSDMSKMLLRNLRVLLQNIS